MSDLRPRVALVTGATRGIGVPLRNASTMMAGGRSSWTATPQRSIASFPH